MQVRVGFPVRLVVWECECVPSNVGLKVAVGVRVWECENVRELTTERVRE